MKSKLPMAFASFCEQSGLQGRSPCRGGGGGRAALRDVFGAVENQLSLEARRSSPEAIFPFGFSALPNRMVWT